MLTYAHRGASAEAPENTLRAFQLAIELDTHGIELDVRLSADGVPVVIHDERLDRTTSGHGHVAEMTVEELRQLDAGAGHGVPTLTEVIDLVGARAALDIEIKTAGAEAATLASLAALGYDSWAISSFDWDVLRAVRALSDQAELWPLTHVVSTDAIRFAEEIRAPLVAVHHRSVDAEVVERLRALGRGIMAWTVNDIDRAREFDAMGITAVCTDDPRRIRAGGQQTGSR